MQTTSPVARWRKLVETGTQAILAQDLPMRICVFGAGAVGSHFAVRLALAGHDVSCVMRGAHLDAVNAGALTLRVGNGEFKAIRPSWAVRTPSSAR
jgi:ketopantoate reductase